MRKTLYLLLLFVALTHLSFSDVAAQSRNSVTGFVFDEARRPVSQIYVELLNDFYTTVSRARTSGSGMYTFTNLPAGNYYVKTLNAGTDFEEQTKSVSLVPISAVEGRGAASEQVDFYLKIKKVRNGTLSTPGVVFAQEIPAEAKTLFENGVNELPTKKDEGLEKIKRAIEVFPDYYLALDRLGNEYLTLGHYEAAFILFSKALLVNPKSFSCMLGIGVAEFRLGQTARAADRFAEAAKLDRTSINVQLWLGITSHAKGDLKAALASLLEANKLSGGNTPEVHWQLARVYKDQNNFPEAAKSLETFLRLRPDAKNAEEIRGIIQSLRQKK